MKTKNLKTILYVLLIVAGILIVGHMEYQEIQEDIQAQADCRMPDTENPFVQQSADVK